MAEIEGIVIRGKGEGRRSGIPTINIVDSVGAEGGIYAAKVEVSGGVYEAAVYIDVHRKLAEAHLFDFSDDVYGKQARITLFKKIREDMQFETKEALQKQIALDIDAIKFFFKV